MAVALFPEPVSPGVAPQAVDGGEVAMPFADQDFDLRGFGGDYLESEVGFDSTIEVSRPAASVHPPHMTLREGRSIIKL